MEFMIYVDSQAVKLKQGDSRVLNEFLVSPIMSSLGTMKYGIGENTMEEFFK